MAQDKGIFSTLVSELVDNDDDYLAIVLQEIAERFALKESNDSVEAAVCATNSAAIL